MEKYLMFGLLILLSFSACDGTVQYNVFVKNNTDQEIKVIFKSPTDHQNKEEQTVEIKPQELKQIIRTEDIDPADKSSTTASHCTYVADYVNAFKQNSQSKIKWCDQKIKFEKTDIQQAEFTIEYTDSDF